MNLQVPYLPIDKFESQYLEEFIKGFHNEEESSEKLMVGERFERYMEACDGYSPYVELVLQGMRMHKYTTLFAEEDISIDMLISMTDDDLINLGITDSVDRRCILEHLKQFGIKNDDELFQLKQESDPLECIVIDDDLIIAQNAYCHLKEINSYLSDVNHKLSKNPPDDYLICDFETALKFFDFTINHAIIQSKRMSELLFGGQFLGNNMINYSLSTAGATLPTFMKEKLTSCHKKGKKLKKKRLIMAIVLGLGIGIAVAAISKK